MCYNRIVKIYSQRDKISMGKIEYGFYINYDTLLEVQKIVHDGLVSQNFLEEIDNLVEEAKLRPNRDMHWDLARLINLYYAPELIIKDKTFAKFHSYLLSLWRAELEKKGQSFEDVIKK